MDASRVPVLGQTMDLELSDGETAEVVPPRRKEAKGLDVSSPAKRSAPEVEGVSLAMLRSLLNEQTQDLKGNLKQELREAIDKSEKKMGGVMAQIQQDLEKKLDSNSTEIAAVKQQQEQLLLRVGALESGAAGASGVASGAAMAPRQPVRRMEVGYPLPISRLP